MPPSETDDPMRIDALTHTGAGRADDGTFVQRVLPGEEITLCPDGTPRIERPSADRVAPPCRHYKSCGGCSMQHARDAFVADWKMGVVRHALASRGLTAVTDRIEVSPPESRRRAKLAGRRTKKGALVGFHGARSSEVVAIPECKVLRPSLRGILPFLEALTRLAATRTTDAEFHLTDTENGVDVLVTSPRDLTRDLIEALPALARDHPVARITWNHEPVATFRPPTVNLSGIAVSPPPRAFLQATAEGEAALVGEVTRITTGASRIVDLFSGCGTFALPLARQAEVHAVEGDETSIEALDRGWRTAPGLKAVTTRVRDLFRMPLTGRELAAFDAVVIDPPRAGAQAQIDQIAASGVPVVAMVSCNPVTFARDAQALTRSGYRMGDVFVVDQFRWSAHVEMVCAFRRC